MDVQQRDPGRFKTSSSTTSSCSKPSPVAGSTTQDFTIQLLDCEDLTGLGNAVKSSLHQVVRHIAGGALFHLDVETDGVYTADNTGHHVCSPCPDCVRRVFKSSQANFHDVSSVPKCVLQHLPQTTSRLQSQKVGCFPVHSKEGERVLAVLVVIGTEVNLSTEAYLKTALKQIAACYNHIQRTFQSQRSSEERVNQQLIKLCGELYDQDAAQLQLKVLKYLEEQTQAERAFLLLVVPDTQELFCQVIGKKILQEEVRFPGQSSGFSVALETKEPITLADIPKESLKGIEEMVECPLRSLLCVPVMNRSENNLIALTCLVNKHNANSFTDKDISTIHQCFRYTATILTSTLAFQNERKLKTQTQALLQVARHLFTNLGELVLTHPEGECFPCIQSRNCVISVVDETLLNSLACPNWKWPRVCSLCKLKFDACICGLSHDLVDANLVEAVWAGKNKNVEHSLKYHHEESKKVEGESEAKERCQDNENREEIKSIVSQHHVGNNTTNYDYDTSKVIENERHEVHMDAEEVHSAETDIDNVRKEHSSLETNHGLQEVRCVDIKQNNDTSKDLENRDHQDITTENGDHFTVDIETGVIRCKKIDVKYRNQIQADSEEEETKRAHNTMIPLFEGTGRKLVVDIESGKILGEASNLDFDQQNSYDKNEFLTETNVDSSEEIPNAGTFKQCSNSYQTGSMVLPATYKEIKGTGESMPEQSLSDSQLSFVTAASESELEDRDLIEECNEDTGGDSDILENDNSDRLRRQADETFFDSFENLCSKFPDINEGILIDCRPDILGFPSDLNGKDGKMRRTTSEPVSITVEQATPEDSKTELNTAFINDDDIIPDNQVNEASGESLEHTILADDEDFQEHGIVDVKDVKENLQDYSLCSDTGLERLYNGGEHEMDQCQSLKYSGKRFSCKEVVQSLISIGRISSAELKNKSIENVNAVEEKVKPVIVTVEQVDLSNMQVPSTHAGSVTLDDLTKLLREIMQQARNLTNAERCSVFLIDHETDELVAKVFDGITTNKDNEVQEEIRLPSTQGIAGQVATSGELLNIRDAYSHPLFYRGIDDSTGFRTRNILCFPIQDEKGRMLGVAQLCNKKNGPCFTQFDEELATAFGIYCCISISHSLMYKKVIDSQVRNSLANELMMYHMKSLMYKKLLESQHRKSLANELMIYHMQVNHDDVFGLTTCDIPHPRFLHSDFVQFSYAPRTLNEDNTSVACLSMFDDLNIISRWRIRRDTLARFVLMVKKGYRNPPYHNWMHAYTVAQFCYQLVKNLRLENCLDDIELFALFVSCLCHDIDHRGTNNTFQTASKSVLAALYSSEGSVLERHHFAQTMCILNTEGCNVFENLNSKDYQTVLDLMREIILATDLAHHFKILKSLDEMAKRGYNKASIKDRKMLLCLLMTSCDLSDQTRPWDNTKKVAALIYKEFFSQGDMEKAKGIEPSEMMDREKAHIPAVQIGFLDHVALPVYRILGNLFDNANEVAQRVENNKEHWEKISTLINLKKGGTTARMTFEEVLAIENEDESSDGQRMDVQTIDHTFMNGGEDIDV